MATPKIPIGFDLGEPPEPSAEKPFPSPYHIFVELPLYAPIRVSSQHKSELWDFYNNEHRIDIYCPQCKDMTVAVGGGAATFSYHAVLESELRWRLLLCSRNAEHEFEFTFKIHDSKFLKVGQYPSMADIDRGKIRQYRNVLDSQHHGELSKALGLAAHGIGIGSFVYLRRIFEDLVEEARQSISSQAGWDDVSFQKARMDEKIQMLASKLPDFLVEQRSLYGIMSAGIHSLSEEQCLEYFPVIQAGIELILDQKVAAAEQKRKLEEARKRIGNIHQTLKEHKNG